MITAIPQNKLHTPKRQAFGATIIDSGDRIKKPTLFRKTINFVKENPKTISLWGIVLAGYGVLLPAVASQEKTRQHNFKAQGTDVVDSLHLHSKAAKSATHLK